MDLPQILHSLVILCALYVAVSVLRNEKRAGIPPAPTLPAVRQAVIEMVGRHADPARDLKIAEFGCGWGGLALLLAKKFPRSTVIGYEISPCPLLVSRLRAALAQRVEISNTDFFLSDWEQFDVIVCYLSPRHMVRIKEKLDALPRKPLLISCSFAMPDSVPVEVRTLHRLVPIPVYAYR